MPIFMKKLLLIILLMTGCSDQITSERAAKLEARIAALEKSAKKPKLDLEPVLPDFGSQAVPMATAADVSKLEQRVWDIEMTNAFREPRWIQIDMTSHGYEKLNTDLLPTLVSAVNASPYLDGFRVTLALANPYSITFQGLTVHTITHSVDMKVSGTVVTNLEEYNASAKHRDFDQTEILYPGRWNHVSFELVPATAQELRTLEISVELKQISVNASR
jgi:hypothetical protein